MDDTKEENKKYKEMQEAMDEEDKIMEEIEKLLTTLPRAEAEKIIAEKYAPLLEKNSEKTHKAADEWRGIVEETEKEEN